MRHAACGMRHAVVPAFPMPVISMDARSKTIPDLDLDLNEVFDRRWRIGEYFIISILTLVCVAALAGVLGSGPLSHTTVQFPSGPADQINYERVVRNHGSNWMRIGVGTGISGVVTVHLSRSLLDSASVESVIPVPASVTASEDGVTYAFDVIHAKGASIDFKMSPYRFGIVSTTVSTGNSSIMLTQTILP